MEGFDEVFIDGSGFCFFALTFCFGFFFLALEDALFGGGGEFVGEVGKLFYFG